MKSIFAAVVILFAIDASSMTCDITGEYRCRGGRTGDVQGRGRSDEEARNHARERAREICGGRVDYVRFIESSSTC